MLHPNVKTLQLGICKANVVKYVFIIRLLAKYKQVQNTLLFEALEDNI